jgi:fatty acid desaturase
MPSPISRAPKARRRQRSVRLTIAVALTTIAALLVLGAVLSGSWLLLTLAAVLGVALGRRCHPHHPHRADGHPS